MWNVILLLLYEYFYLLCILCMYKLCALVKWREIVTAGCYTYTHQVPQCACTVLCYAIFVCLSKFSRVELLMELAERCRTDDLSADR